VPGSDLRGAGEQAALHRVAELVARAAAPEDVFAAVTAEASQLLDGIPVTLTRFSGEHDLVVLATHHGPAPIGARIDYGSGTLPDRVRRDALVDRVDDYAHERDAGLAAQFGLRAAVAAPVAVMGDVWGMFTATSPGAALPPGVEDRLEVFARLVAAALATIQARTELQALADEQAALRQVAELVALDATQARRQLYALADEQSALRRVAELVAHGTALADVFQAVATEAAHLLGDQATALLRYDPDDVAVAVAVAGSPAPLGLRVPSHAGTPTGQVRRTGQPVRVDSFADTALATLATELGVAAGVAVPVTVEGRIWGTLTTSTPGPPLPAGTENRLLQFAELAAAAIANAENKATLTASRARVVATADETRRQVQRDVHDGAQQRLVHTIITLKLARDAIAAGGDAAGLVAEALAHAERANRELRDLVRGMLPAALTRGGLHTGIDSLVADLALPVDLHVSVPRLPAQLETTAYFVVAEALTNVVKHAQADHAEVRLTIEAGALVVDVRDDGIGGADPARGTGLTGLLDRVEASYGTLTIASPPGHGTILRATVPIPSARSAAP
jgi:signal transduction histidine kinase